MADAWLSSSYTHRPNLKEYYKRIKYEGSEEATLETLTGLQWCHSLSIPYEVLDIHMGVKISLDPAAIERKLVLNGRGGFCYEHNILFMYVLQSLGFEVTPITARVRWQKPEDLMSGLTHLILKVKVNKCDYVCDVGLSSCGSPVPLLIHTESQQATPMDTRRILKSDERYVQQVQLQNVWHDVYIFTLDRSYPTDWEIGSYFCSTHPSSLHVQNIIVCMPIATGRHRLVNKQLVTRYIDGTAEIREINSELEFMHVLRSVFHINLAPHVSLCPPNMTW